ncbi:MAG TPA: alpha/beta hydrolase [Xanthomonadaceae bacterium]|nr:alpha/beta hydrolase [Xanthomonadaceae bacterium]
MPRYWLISDRDDNGTGSGSNPNGLTYWVSDGGALDDIGNWKQLASLDAFKGLLIAAADAFPMLTPAQNEQQSHVTLLVHGFNEDFAGTTGLYQKVCDSLFAGPDSLGLCVLYDWPSLGSVLGYEPDRATARKCADDLTDILSELYDWLIAKQKQTIGNPQNACKAKVSLIAHSMGNYLLQKAMAAAWTRSNQPLLVSLINQLVMVAADVDNDLFDAGAPDSSDGEAIANFTYRVTALYSGRDAVLGASAGLKHFGTRRLGRSGLAHRPPLVDSPPATDNVWDFDCSALIPANVGSESVHSAYFSTPAVMDLMRKILKGVDRGQLP